MRFNLFQKRAAPDDSPLPAEEARKLILLGEAPANLRVSGHLNLSDNSNLKELPDGLTVASLDVSGCGALGSLPNALRVRRLNLNGCRSLAAIPLGLSCYELEMRETDVRELPPDLRVEYRLDLSGCSRLERLPEGLKVGTLLLNDCVSLEALPDGLDVNFLDVSGCAALRGWPQKARVGIGRLRAANCAQITSLPRWLTDVAQLDVSGRINLNELPEGLRVTSWLDLANSGIKSLPASIKGARLRWRGVPIDERIAFRPETITATEILAETTTGSEQMPSATPQELAAAIIECIDAGARVINLSLALAQPSTKGEQALEQALNQAVRRSVMVVAAAGNQGALGSSSITRHPWVIPVVACDLRGRPMNESNLGRSIGRQGLTAPGDAITSLSAEGRPLTLGGTCCPNPRAGISPASCAGCLRFRVSKRTSCTLAIPGISICW